MGIVFTLSQLSASVIMVSVLFPHAAKQITVKYRTAVDTVNFQQLALRSERQLYHGVRLSSAPTISDTFRSHPNSCLFSRYSFPPHFFPSLAPCGWCFLVVEIRRPVWSRVSQHQTAEYWEASFVSWWAVEPHKSNTCTHKDRKKEIKKIALGDWLPCCLAKRLEKKKRKSLSLYVPVLVSNSGCRPWVSKPLSLETEFMMLLTSWDSFLRSTAGFNLSDVRNDAPTDCAGTAACLKVYHVLRNLVRKKQFVFSWMYIIGDCRLKLRFTNECIGNFFLFFFVIFQDV